MRIGSVPDTIGDTLGAGPMKKRAPVLKNCIKVVHNGDKTLGPGPVKIITIALYIVLVICIGGFNEITNGYKTHNWLCLLVFVG